MFKKIVVAAAFAFACPALVFAQDISFLFGGGPDGGPVSSEFIVSDFGVFPGSVNIFASPNFAFDAADIDFFSSNPSVAVITGGVAFDVGQTNGLTVPPFSQQRFDSTVLTTTSATEGNLFSVNVTRQGIDPDLAGIGLDPFFDPVNGFLLARVDFVIVGNGTTEFGFGLGPQGIFSLPNNDLSDTVTFGSATLCIPNLTPGGGCSIPEPSSTILLIMGSVAMVARRKRA